MLQGKSYSLNALAVVDYVSNPVGESYGMRRTYAQFRFQWGNKNIKAIQMERVGRIENRSNPGIYERAQYQWPRTVRDGASIDLRYNGCGFFRVSR